MLESTATVRGAESLSGWDWMMDGLPRTVLWRGILLPGAEWCELARDGDGWRMAGTVLTVVASKPVMVTYGLALNGDWSTRDVQVEVRSGDVGERRLRLTADPERRWQVHREPAPNSGAAPEDAEALRGLVDIDLGFSPATNTLPIRRLAPAIGAAVEVTAVWVRFPELTIEPLPQRYIRLEERRFRYESAGGAFVAEIEVDDLGLVTRYQGGWERIAEASSTRGT